MTKHSTLKLLLCLLYPFIRVLPPSENVPGDFSHYVDIASYQVFSLSICGVHFNLHLYSFAIFNLGLTKNVDNNYRFELAETNNYADGTKNEIVFIFYIYH